MKIYVIRNNEDKPLKNLGYLFYFSTNKFYIELPKDINEWETPLILSSFVKYNFPNQLDYTNNNI